MNNQELVIQQGGTPQMANNLTDIQRLGNILAASGYFSDAREMAQAAVKVMAGQELGIPPVASMMGINIIKGKVALGGNLIASRIRAHGYDYKHKQFDAKGCVLTFWGKPVDGKRELLGESSFTEEDAKSAGCYGDMYKKYPKNMYFNRAISNGAKWYTPDVFGGAPVYTPEELGARVDSEGDMVHRETPKPAETVAVPPPDPKPVAIANGINPEVAKMWARMKGKDATLSVFKDLQSSVAEISGSDVEYYRLLNEAGVNDPSEFKSTAPARQCALKIHEMLERWEKAAAPPPGEGDERFHVTDADIPEYFDAN